MTLIERRDNLAEFLTDAMELAGGTYEPGPGMLGYGEDPHVFAVTLTHELMKVVRQIEKGA